MTHVRFDLPSSLDLQLSEQLPVKVFNSNMEIVARTTASQSLDLPGGDYFVQAVLPNGELASVGFAIPSDEPDVFTIGLNRAPISTVDLFRDGGTAASSRLKFQLPDDYLQSIIASYDVADVPPVRHDVEVAVSLKLRDLRSGGLNGITGIEADAGTAEAKVRLVEAQDEPVRSDKAVEKLLSQPDERFAWNKIILQFAQPDTPIWNIRLPVSQTEGASIEYRQSPNGWFPHIRLAEATADLLLQYAGSQQAGEFAQLAERGRALVEQGAAKNMPVLAILGGYALLRTARLDELRSVLDVFSERAVAFPDARIIVGELCARTGDHDGAIEAFLQVRWPPFMSLGMRFLLDRLTAYSGLGKSKDEEPRKLVAKYGEKVSSVLERAQSFAVLIDFDRPLLTFVTQPSEKGVPKCLSAEAFEALAWQGVRLVMLGSGSHLPPVASRSPRQRKRIR